MRAFAELFGAIDATTKTGAKVDALARYFATAPPEDAAWTIYFLTGRKINRLIPARELATWAMETASVPVWLFDESYQAVGDLAETIALLLPEPAALSDQPSNLPLHWWVEERLQPMRGWDDVRRREALLDAWRQLDEAQRFVWNKLITGSFRVGVSQSLVMRALAQVSGVDPQVIAHRMMGNWEPTAAFVRSLLAPDGADADASRPYPFYLAYPLEDPLESLGSPNEWQLEWKWDGIRSQLIRRQGRTYVWSRGEDLVTERFPELDALGALLPEGTAIDGEIVVWRDGKAGAFADLQKRIGRKDVTRGILQKFPVALVAYDLLEHAGADTREFPLSERRLRLEELAAGPRVAGSGRLILSPTLPVADWDEAARVRSEARNRGVEGLMLKRRNSPYRVGRRRGDWWKWKIDALSVDAVLIYAQPGHGRRAGLYTDYTFAVWDEGTLVPFAKAYSGLTDDEIQQVDAFVRRNTLEKFGPVRSVKPELVFELAFEGIQRSPRHRSGIAVRFPRMARWRTDKKPEEADTLDALNSLLNYVDRRGAEIDG